MGITYFKRYRMEFDLRAALFTPPDLPPGYELVPWQASRLQDHAEAKYGSFRCEVDANVFPCLGDRDGCLKLMCDISSRGSFCPEATWLISGPARRGVINHAARVPCATVQGLLEANGFGSIQNLGVVPEHRGIGLGVIAMHQALAGFKSVGRRRVYLEVTAQNTAAIQLYQQLGFQRVRTVYKAADVAYA